MWGVPSSSSTSMSPTPSALIASSHTHTHTHTHTLSLSLSLSLSLFSLSHTQVENAFECLCRHVGMRNWVMAFFSPLAFGMFASPSIACKHTIAVVQQPHVSLGEPSANATQPTQPTHQPASATRAKLAVCKNPSLLSLHFRLTHNVERREKNNNKNNNKNKASKHSEKGLQQ